MTPPEAPGRNAPCPCGSGKKYKQCCLAKDEAAERAARAKEQPAQPAAKDKAEEKPAKGAPKPQHPHQPQRATQQPWKRSAGGGHPVQRTIPRKSGGK